MGNSFPLSLLRRPVRIVPVPAEELRSVLENGEAVSFWGHKNTLKVASSFAGVDLTPSSGRPVLELSDSLLPVLDGIEFGECWVLSPDYAEKAFRPRIGEEVQESKIKSWQILKIMWE